MTMRTRIALAAVFASALAISASHAVHARTIATVAGRASSNTASECAIYDQSNVAGSGSAFGIRNNCVASLNWKMALPVDTASAFTVIVRAKEAGTAAASVSCTARTQDSSGLLVGLESLASTTNTTAWQDLTMSPPAVPFGGTLLLNCNISGANNAKMSSVDFF